MQKLRPKSKFDVIDENAASFYEVSMSLRVLRVVSILEFIARQCIHERQCSRTHYYHSSGWPCLSSFIDSGQTIKPSTSGI